MPRTARSRFGTSARLGAVAAVAALTLGACATPGGSTAIQVEDQRMSLGQLEDAANACAAPLGFPQQAMDVQIRTLALQGLIGRVLVEDNNYTFSDAQIRQVLKEQQVEAALDAPDCAPLIRDVGAFFLAATKVGADEGIKQISAMDVQVNPRIGTWDAERLALLNTNGSLSKVGPTSIDSQI